ncbi:hypothetical protein G9A89_006430 [Geosiphon pyriformis]|nr:hypothetical protein G9A89_006430 [Geosiphon pyriformis]
MWSDVKKLEHIVQQYEHCSRNHNTSLGNISNLVEHQLCIYSEINREIEKYTKQRFSITFADKGKGRLQTPVGTPKQIQLPTWKKQRFDSPVNLSYHYISGSTINIINTATTNMTMPLNRILFQKITDSKEEESSNQEVNKQNLILEHSEIKTLVNQTPENQNNQNSNIINQHLSPVIQQQPQLLPQQQIQQQPQPNLDPITYTPIAKLEKFTSEENDAQVWLNDVEKAIAVNGWNDARAMQAIPYFLQNTTNSCNNNSINRLANTFTIIKQRENEAVTTYLGCFYRNLHQIQAIDANYFTVAQILNQFICRLYSSILQRVCLLHSIGLQATVTNTQDFEAAKLKANYTQAINLVMNRSSELDSKLKQFSDSINQKLEEYLADNHAIY